MGNNKSRELIILTDSQKKFNLAFLNDPNRCWVDSLNFSLENGEFSSSQKPGQKQAVITLIQKKANFKGLEVHFSY